MFIQLKTHVLTYFIIWSMSWFQVQILTKSEHAYTQTVLCILYKS